MRRRSGCSSSASSPTRKASSGTSARAAGPPALLLPAYPPAPMRSARTTRHTCVCAYRFTGQSCGQRCLTACNPQRTTRSVQHAARSTRRRRLGQVLRSAHRGRGQHGRRLRQRAARRAVRRELPRTAARAARRIRAEVPLRAVPPTVRPASLPAAAPAPLRCRNCACSAVRSCRKWLIALLLCAAAQRFCTVRPPCRAVPCRAVPCRAVPCRACRARLSVLLYPPHLRSFPVRHRLSCARRRHQRTSCCNTARRVHAACAGGWKRAQCGQSDLSERAVRKRRVVGLQHAASCEACRHRQGRRRQGVRVLRHGQDGRVPGNLYRARSPRSHPLLPPLF